MKNEGIVWLEVNRLKPHELNNEVFQDISGTPRSLLLKSVKERGIFHPLVVTKDGTILSGHQRWMAAREVGLEKVPCRVVDVDPDSEEAMAILFEANLAQRPLSVDEFVTALQKYEDSIIPDPSEIPEHSLIPPIRDALLNGKISLKLARAIARFPKEEQEQFISLVRAGIETDKNEKIKVLEQTLKDMEDQLKQAKEREDALKQKIKDYKERLAEARSAKKELEVKISDLRGEKNALKKRILQLTDEIDELKLNPSPEALKQIKEKEEEIKQIKQQVAVRDAKMAELQKKLEEVEENNAVLYQQLQQERKKQRETERQLKEKFQNALKQTRELYEKQLQEVRKQQKSGLITDAYTYASIHIQDMHERLGYIQMRFSELNNTDKRKILFLLETLRGELTNMIERLSAEVGKGEPPEKATGDPAAVLPDGSLPDDLPPEEPEPNPDEVISYEELLGLEQGKEEVEDEDY